jgi:hypothetical protein
MGLAKVRPGWLKIYEEIKMKMRQFLMCAFVVSIALVTQLGASTFPPAALPARQPPARVYTHTGFGLLPMQFEANEGQADAMVKFLAHGPGYTVYLTSGEAVVVLSAPAAGHPSKILRVQFADTVSEPEVVGLDKLPGLANYYIGNDPEQWHTGIETFAKVGYQAVYPGIDAVFYGNQGRLEHDFVVAPGSNPDVITLKVHGADALEINGDGDLLLAAAGGELRLRKPLAYQEAGGSRTEIAARYVLKGPDTYGFAVAAYDADRPLVIDPVLDYSTYFGGDSDDYGYAITADPAGNIYLTGSTNSTTFPVVNAAQGTFGGGGVACPTDLPTRVCYDVFVTKINAAGNTILYSTYLGLPGDDEGRAIATDPSGNAYITGQVSLAGDPPLEDLYLYKYALVAKLGPTGNLIYAKAYGDTSDIIGLGIAADAAGLAYVTGEVSGAILTSDDAIQPEKGEMIDAFVAVLDPEGYVLYSTYLGGSGGYCGECMSSGRGIAVDDNGQIYVTGQAAPSFPVTANAYQTDFRGFWQAFVVKIDPARAGGAGLVYSTLLGGSQTEIGQAITLDQTGKVYVTGAAKSDDLPTTPGAYDRTCGTDGLCNPTTVCYPTIPPTCETKPQEDVFLAKFDLSKSGAASLLLSTYIGGSGRDEGSAIALDASGNAYLTGVTVSPDFPMVNPVQATIGGNMDAFALKLNPAGSGLDYATFLGGGGDDFGQGIVVDTAGNAYLTGWTGSAAFPNAHPLQPWAGGWEAFIAKIDSSGSGPTLSYHLFLPAVTRKGG